MGVGGQNRERAEEPTDVLGARRPWWASDLCIGILGRLFYIGLGVQVLLVYLSLKFGLRYPGVLADAVVTWASWIWLFLAAWLGVAKIRSQSKVGVDRVVSEVGRAIDSGTLGRALIDAEKRGKIRVYASVAVATLGQSGFVDVILGAPDPRLMIPLAEMLEVGPQEKEAATEALLSLLPTLDVGDTPHLNRSSIFHYLRTPEKWAEQLDPLAAAILDCVERIGDRQALPHMEYLSTGDDLPSEMAERIRRCLVALGGRESLLRATVNPPETDLLRSASGSSVEETDLLLRPGAPDR